LKSEIAELKSEIAELKSEIAVLNANQKVIIEALSNTQAAVRGHNWLEIYRYGRGSL